MRSVTVGGRRGAEVFVRPDMTALGDDISGRARQDPLLRETIVYLTCLHELGHAFGLVHTRNFDDVMFFFGYGGDIAEYFGPSIENRHRVHVGTVVVRHADDPVALSVSSAPVATAHGSSSDARTA